MKCWDRVERGLKGKSSNFSLRESFALDLSLICRFAAQFALQNLVSERFGHELITPGGTQADVHEAGRMSLQKLLKRIPAKEHSAEQAGDGGEKKNEEVLREDAFLVVRRSSGRTHPN